MNQFSAGERDESEPASARAHRIIENSNHQSRNNDVDSLQERRIMIIVIIMGTPLGFKNALASLNGWQARLPGPQQDCTLSKSGEPPQP